MNFKIPKKFQLFREQIRYHIGLNLLKTKKRPHIIFKVDINQEFYKFLQKKYQLNGRFKKCSILDDLDLNLENYCNETDSHCILENSFSVKLTKEKEKKLNCKNKNKFSLKSVKAMPSLTIKFSRQNKIFLTESDLNYIDN